MELQQVGSSALSPSKMGELDHNRDWHQYYVEKLGQKEIVSEWYSGLNCSFLRSQTFEIIPHHRISWEMSPGCGCNGSEVGRRGEVTPVSSNGIFSGSRSVITNIYYVSQERMINYFYFLPLGMSFFLVYRKAVTT